MKKQEVIVSVYRKGKREMHAIRRNKKINKRDTKYIKGKQLPKKNKGSEGQTAWTV